MNQHDRERLKQLYDEQVAATGAADRHRLRRARQEAMESQTGWTGTSSWWHWSWVPAGAAASLMVVLLWPMGERLDAPGDEVPAYAEVHDMEILLDEQSLEFYSDLEFYLWLEEEGRENVL